MTDYVIPTVQGLGRFDSPIWSAVAGTVTAGVISRFLLKGGRTTAIASGIGALTGLGSNLFYKAHEGLTGEVWIPEARRKEHEINEYYDILDYIKNEGLYQKAREEIVHATGLDVEDFSQLIDNRKELTKQKRKELEEEKKALYVDQPEGWEARRTEINQELNVISEDWEELYLPEPILQALEYKNARDTTLYGIDPYGDRMEVMQAFPYKDKWFFSEFADANEKDRERILELVPDNQRRIYKALWGQGLEEKKPLEYYMQKYHIPDWDWEGWKPEYDLDKVKVKTVLEEKIDLEPFNFWADDIVESKYVPSLKEDGSNDIHTKPTNNFQGYQALKENLQAILQGQGLYNVKVVVNPSNGTTSDISMNYQQDRSGEIEEHLRRYANEYV